MPAIERHPEFRDSPWFEQSKREPFNTVAAKLPFVANGPLFRLQHIMQDRNVLGGTSGDNEQMPDAVRVSEAGIDQ
ncbi:MAG: hypothetical protein ACLQHK_13940 [Gallionellaceae bacterium]